MRLDTQSCFPSSVSSISCQSLQCVIRPLCLSVSLLHIPLLPSAGWWFTVLQSEPLNPGRSKVFDLTQFLLIQFPVSEQSACVKLLGQLQRKLLMIAKENQSSFLFCFRCCVKAKVFTVVSCDWQWKACSHLLLAATQSSPWIASHGSVSLCPEEMCC